MSVNPGTNEGKNRIIFRNAPGRVLGASAVATRCLGNGVTVRVPRRHHGKGNGDVAVHKTENGGLGKMSMRFPLNGLVIMAKIDKSNGSALVGRALRPVLSRRFCHSLGGPVPCSDVRNVRGVSGMIGMSRDPVNEAPHDGPTACANMFDSVHSLFIKLPRTGVHNCGPNEFSFGIGNNEYRTYNKGKCGAVRVGFLPSICMPYRMYRNGHCGHRALRMECGKGDVTSMLSVAVGRTMRFFRGIPRVLGGVGTLRDMKLNCVGLKRDSAALSNKRDRHIGLTARLSGHSANGALCVLSRPAANLRFRSVHVLVSMLRGLMSENGAIVVVRRGLSIVGLTS